MCVCEHECSSLRDNSCFARGEREREIESKAERGEEQREREMTPRGASGCLIV